MAGVGAGCAGGWSTVGATVCGVCEGGRLSCKEFEGVGLVRRSWPVRLEVVVNSLLFVGGGVVSGCSRTRSLEWVVR